jgi:hypothetical protein
MIEMIKQVSAFCADRDDPKSLKPGIYNWQKRILVLFDVFPTIQIDIFHF